MRRWHLTLPLLLSFLVSVLPAAPFRGAEIVARDGPLVKYDNGLVHDTAAGLEWLPGPDRGMNWAEAQGWIAGLNASDDGWRMPTSNELETLFRIGDGVRNITPLLVNSGYWIWAADNDSRGGRWVFGFSYGGEGWSGQPPEDGGRALAVREHRNR